MRKQVRISKAVCFSWCMIGALICMFLPESMTSRLHVTFLNFYKFTPSLGRSIPLAAVTKADSVPDTGNEQQQQLRRLESEKQQLENHLANLSAELADEHAKVESLSGMRSRFPALTGAKFVNADVIIAGIKTSDSRIVVNRGEADGICKGQYVLADNSVIGIVHQTWSRTAQVKIITDKDSSIAVEIDGSKAMRVMKGTGKNNARIGMVPNSKRIAKDAAVYTYKNPGLLDAPIIVGKVTQCRPDDDNPLLWDITVIPVVKAEELLSVTIVVMNP